ncbi:MAG: M48 family metallopeptidase [Methylomonas sp.]|nr:M48 family metallopeptidase [Methylomonas sp.]PPD22122.1 MAG: peptidase M48 Ste24p [Methylomonas sp.]PPD23745.1 MAG: peptidase M48 Ste24p [Methylomonas sp.]PPD31651.1 MAG: peptidase M48 Ste24p [Methylomonas sp.]PPD42391.1 MAG: peptidase M48 Ste24p [Methylomonas sp.]
MPRSSLAMALLLCLTPGVNRALEIEKIQLPDMGDSSGTLISPLQEKELGAAFFRNLHAKTDINQDAEIQEYIHSIGRQLAANSDMPSNPFHFFVVMDPNINAFAGPGGYIGINSGLILLSESESELAAVMAHEIAHVTQRHLYRQVEAASKMSIPTIAATLAAILIGTQSPRMGQAAMMAIQAGNIQFQIDFTRDHEKEADRVGMQILTQSNFDPRAMPTFFERMQQSTRYYGRGIPEFLRTHPVSESRIADTRGRAERYPYRQYPDSLGYLLTKARLYAMTEPNKAVVLQHFATLQNQGTAEQRAVARYGLGITHFESQQYAEAAIQFQKLVDEYPNTPQYITALARTALDSRNYDQANRLFAMAAETFPNNDVIKVEYSRSLLKSGHPERARQVLLSLSEPRRTQAFYFELMSQTFAALNQLGESHRYMAEHYFATGRSDDAVMQIRLGQKAQNPSYQLQAILDERLNFFLNDIKERKRER